MMFRLFIDPPASSPHVGLRPLGVWSRHLLERVENESIWLRSPCFADKFVRGETVEGFKASAEVVGIDEVIEMPLELCVAVVVIALNGCLFDRAVHSFDLAVGPRMADLCEPMFDAVFPAAHGEH